MAWSSAITVTEPIEEPISVDQAKEFVSIEADVGEFDALLASFIEAARGHVEAVTGTRLVEQTIELLADEWSDLLTLPIGPVMGIVSIGYDDPQGVGQTLDANTYELTGAGFERGIRTKVGYRWPSGIRRAAGAIRVRLTVGYGSLPAPIKAALLLMVSDQFAFRESGVVGTVTAEMKSSMRVDALLGNYRIWL